MKYESESLSYIKSLIRQGEHQTQDFKYCISDSKKIARSLAAFSNTDGGRLLIGIKDNGSVVGISTDEEYYMVEAAAQMYCKPEVKFSSKSYNVLGKIVLEITIPQSEKPVSAPTEDGKWMVFIRVDDQNLLANKVLLDVWKKRKDKTGIFLKYTETEKKLLEYLKINETVTLSKFCKIAQITRRDAQKILVDFIVLDIVRIQITEKATYYSLNHEKLQKYENNENIV